MSIRRAEDKHGLLSHEHGKGVVVLPVPNDAITKQYTKTEAASILSVSTPGSPTRTNVMCSMINNGLAPTTLHNLKLLVTRYENGEAFADESWDTPEEDHCNNDDLLSQLYCQPVMPDCEGIRSDNLNKLGIHNMKYCYDKNWILDADDKWRSKFCEKEAMDNGRCIKCSSQYNNINRTRHPALFKPPSASSSVKDLSERVSNRIDAIEVSAIPTDKELQTISGLLRLEQHYIIDVGKSKVFISCHAEGCKNHRVCRKRSDKEEARTELRSEDKSR